MATDVERLIVTLEARTREYERAMARAQSVTVGAMRKIELDMQASAVRQQALWRKAGSGIETSIRRAFAPLAAVTAGLFSGRALIEFADSFTRIENALRVANVPAAELAGTMENLFQIATKHGAPIESLGVLYGRLALVQKELAISSEDLLGFTDNVGAALRVSGKSAAEASGALLQLSQALGSGVVRAEEFNSILEGAPAIAQAVARGLTEAGGSVAKLRALVIDGQVSSEAFFKAFQLGSVETQRQAALAARTIGQAWENIKTTITEAVGSLDNATDASSRLATELDGVASGLKNTAREVELLISVSQQLGTVFDKLTTLSPPAAAGLNIEGLRASIAEWEKLLEQAEARGETAAAANMRARIAELQAEIARGVQSLIGPAWEKGGRESAEAYATGFKTFSLKDAIANDLAGSLDAILERQKKLLSGGGGGGAGAGLSIDLQFRTSGEAEQLQAIIRQREAVASLTSDLASLESALAAHFDTPFDDIMGFGAADEARAAFAQAIRDMESLAQAFIDGQVPAREFDNEVAAIRARLESLAGTGNELDPFIDNMLKAVGVAGQLKSTLDQAKSAISGLGSSFSRQSFSVPGGGGTSGPTPVTVTRPIIVEPAGIAKGVSDGTRDLRSSIDGIERDFRSSIEGAARDVRSSIDGSVSSIRGVDSSVKSIGSQITGAVSQQTTSLSNAFAAGFNRIAGTIGAGVGGPGSITGGRTPGTLGGPVSPSFSFQVAGPAQLLQQAFAGFESQIQAQMGALSAEAGILQTALQFKDLTPKERKEAELRLAEISLENAKNQEKLAIASLNLTTQLEKLSSGLAGFDLAIESIAARHAAFNLNSSAPSFLGGGLTSSLFNGGNLINSVNTSAQKLTSGASPTQTTQQTSGGQTVNQTITILAQDVNSFKNSERDILRTQLRMLQSVEA